MANLQGLMGGPLLPEQTVNPSSRDIQLNAVRSAASGVRNAVGGAAGFDARNPKERLMQELPKLDPTKVADQQKIVKLVGAVNPAKAMELKTQYSNEAKAFAAKSATATANTASRADVAKQLTATHPQLADAVLKEDPSATNILDAALSILSQKQNVGAAANPKTINLVDVTTNTTVGSAIERGGEIFAHGSDIPMTPAELDGLSISASHVKPSAPLVRIGDDTVAERLEKRLTAQGEQLSITPEDAQSAITLADNNRKVLSKVESGMATGAAPEFIAEQASLLQGIYQAVGIPAPNYIQQMTMNSSELTAMQNEAMIPFIEMQGRGWTDADRINYYKTSAGFKQAWQYNEAVATLKLAGAVNTIELEQFANRRKNLDELTDSTGVSLWADYLKNVPRTHIDLGFQRSPVSLKYDRSRVIEDTADLSRYWAKEKPKGFKLKLDGKVVELSWKDIKSSAAGKNNVKNQSVRGWLAHRENKGQIIGGIY